MEDGYLNERVGEDRIREYVYYTETGLPTEDRADGLEGVGVLDVPSEDAPTGGGFVYPVPAEGEDGVVLMVREALRSGEEYDARSASADPLQELKTETGMKSYRVKEAFAEELEMLRVPVFAVGDSGSLWSGGKVPFDRKALTERFSLARVDATIRFSTSLTDAVTVDVEEGDSEPKCKYLSGREKDYLARQLAGKANVRWWHRIRDRAGFCINGFINHYPDFAVMTERGNLVMVEVKGGHLDGTDSREKAALGRTWADNAGTNIKYFMVFSEEKDAIPEAKSLEDFLTILDNL